MCDDFGCDCGCDCGSDIGSSCDSSSSLATDIAMGVMLSNALSSDVYHHTEDSYTETPRRRVAERVRDRSSRVKRTPKIMSRQRS